MMYKTIVKGRLEFGSAQTCEKVMRLWQTRVENYHKNDVIFKDETLYDLEAASFNLGRMVLQCSKKTWQNSSDLLTYLAQYAIAGQVGMWMVEDGKVIAYAHVEPKNDHSLVQAYQRGLKLATDASRAEEAMAALDCAIEKYDKHAQAYERRAYVNYTMGKFHDALRDYNKSIQIYGNDAAPFYGRAIIYFDQENYQEALADFDAAIKRSIPLQPIYWRAHRRKAQVLLKMRDYKSAESVLHTFNQREFLQKDSNYHYQRWSLYQQAVCLVETQRSKDALPLLERALQKNNDLNLVDEAQILKIKEEASKSIDLAQATTTKQNSASQRTSRKKMASV